MTHTENMIKKKGTSLEEDIDLLALMCSLCTFVTKERFILPNKKYLYYVPASDSFVKPAKYLFAKNGLNMHLHNSKILGVPGQDVLRVEYTVISKDPAISDMIERIKMRRLSLFEQKTLAKRLVLLKELENLKQY